MNPQVSIVLFRALVKNESMTVYVRSLETVVPKTMLVQTEARDVFAAQPGLSRLGSRLVNTCFDSAAIDTRFTAVEETLCSKPSPRFPR
jgi:predicted naringenin-chalcone synthase